MNKKGPSDIWSDGLMCAIISYANGLFRTIRFIDFLSLRDDMFMRSTPRNMKL